MKNLSIVVFLSGLFLVASCASPSESTEGIAEAKITEQTPGPTLLSEREFLEKMEIPDVQLIDVRTDGEVADGMIENAVQIDISDWDAFAAATTLLDKTKPVLVYCKSGGRSGRAAEYLSKEGFQVFDLEGGYDGWTKK